MNVELKALISIIFDGIKIEQDVVSKKSLVLLFPDVFAVLSDIGPAVSNWGDLISEIKSLPQSANALDLVAFIQSKLASLSNDIVALRDHQG